MRANSSLSDTLLLDNPVWHALSTEQRALALGNRLAKRFPSGCLPIWRLDRSISQLLTRRWRKYFRGRLPALALDTEPSPAARNWEMVHSGEMYQMICETPALSDDRTRSSAN